MDPATLMMVGTGMKLVGNYGANIQQSIAERANAKFYAQQEQLGIAATLSAVRAAEREMGYKTGMARTTYGASGLDVGAGSSLTNLANMIADGMAEADYARRKGELDLQLIRQRRINSESTADMLSSPGYNLVQAGTSLLGHMTASESTAWGNANRNPSAPSGTGYLGDFTF